MLARWLVALLGLAILAADPVAGPALEADAPPKDRINLGMSLSDVRRTLGPPKRVARQIFHHRYREQWLYEQPARLRVHFDCVRGQPARVVRIQPLDGAS